MKMVAKISLASLVLVLLCTVGALAQGFLWDGTQWDQLPYEAKVGYIKGIGNLADFECAASQGKGPCISRAFVDELKTRTVDQIIKEVDKYYLENPGKVNSPVIEVVLRRCTSVCPPGVPGTPKGK
jgi:hypothetical protein